MNQILMKEEGAKDFYADPAVTKKLSSANPVRGAFELAYKDMQRTMWGMSKNPNNKKIKEEIFGIVENFYKDYAENIQHYSIQDFDGTHMGRCSAIVEVAKEYGFDQFHIGQAQKIINMFFKYIALVDDRLNEHLNYLHIPLDGVILNGIKENFCNTKIAELAVKCQPWSRISDYKVYLDMQQALRESFSCPIIFEYNNWGRWRLND